MFVKEQGILHLFHFMHQLCDNQKQNVLAITRKTPKPFLAHSQRVKAV
jgi:hypothetical protein